MKNPLIIKGALYQYNKCTLLIPHYTGEYSMVDCDRYLTKEALKDLSYSKNWIKDNEENYIIEDGVKYFYAEYSLYHTDEMELLSDVSDLQI